MPGAVSKDLARLQRGNRMLVIALLGVVIVMLSAILWALATVLPQRNTPRTFVERQLAMLERVVKEKPRSEEAWADYILALVAAKQYSKAQAVIAAAEKAVGKDVVDILYVRARLAYARGDRGEAEQLVKKAIESGLAFRKKELERLAQQATFPDPRVIKGKVLASAYYFHAQLLAEKKQWQEAVEALTKSLAEEPASADALVFRGNVYLELSETASATADFEQALKYIPGFQPALDGLKKAGAAK